MTKNEAFQDLLTRLKAGEEDAQSEVFRRFANRLLVLARARLDDRLKRTTDPEDVAQSVWQSFFTRQSSGQFEFKDWGGVWAILTLMVIRKCSRRSVAARREKRDVRREVGIDHRTNDASEFDVQLEDREPTPAEAAALSEFVENLMTGLSERDREILVLRLQGHTVPEISEKVRLSERSVHRKLIAIRERAVLIGE